MLLLLGSPHAPLKAVLLAPGGNIFFVGRTSRELSNIAKITFTIFDTE